MGAAEGKVGASAMKDDKSIHLSDVSKTFAAGSVIATMMYSSNSGLPHVKVYFDDKEASLDEFYYPYLIAAEEQDVPEGNGGLVSRYGYPYKGVYFCYSGKEICEVFIGPNRDIIDGFRSAWRRLNPVENYHDQLTFDGDKLDKGIVEILVDGVTINSSTMCPDWVTLRIPEA